MRDLPCDKESENGSEENRAIKSYNQLTEIMMSE